MGERDIDKGWLAAPDRAPWWTCVLRGRELSYVYASDAYHQSFPGRKFLGNTAYDVMRELENQSFFGFLQRVFDTGETQRGEGTILFRSDSTEGMIERRLEFSYAPIRNAKGDITEIIAEGRFLEPKNGTHAVAHDREARFGAKSLTDAELLCLFLEDHKGLAEEVLYLHQNLRGVFSASREHLLRLKPPGSDALHALDPAAITRLQVAGEIQRRILLQRVKGRSLLSSQKLLKAYLSVSLADEPREQLRVLFLDNTLHLIADEVMWTGTFNHAPVYPREVCRRAIELSAASFAMVHNHPGGSATFSGSDILVTKNVIAAAQALGLVVHDHYLVTRDKVSSMRQTSSLRWN